MFEKKWDSGRVQIILNSQKESSNYFKQFFYFIFYSLMLWTCVLIILQFFFYYYFTMIYFLNFEKKYISNFNVEVIFLRVSVLIFRKMRG